MEHRMQFLDPTNDYAFKKIFGNENKKHILISFLNNILRLPKEQQITQVTLLNPRQAPYLPGTKETILDVRCHDHTGAEYIVEMQVIPQEFFDKRVLYYAAKAYSEQLNEGEEYQLLKPVIFLGILNFEFTADPHYLSTHCIHNIETKEHVLKDFRFTFAELPKFNKTEAELQTVEDKWLYFLKYAKKLTAIPEVIHEAAIREAFEIVNRLHWDKDTLHLYSMRNIYVQDEINRVVYGYKKGKIEGKIEGKVEGKMETQHTIAHTMLTSGVPTEEVARYTGLPLNEVKALLEKIRVHLESEVE
jgi:predicted transposase/invertase (TIGR01784 family)